MGVVAIYTVPANPGGCSPSPTPSARSSSSTGSSPGATSSGSSGVGKVRAAALMHEGLRAELVGNQRTLPRRRGGETRPGRRAPAGPVGQFLGWCEARGLGLRDVSPLHVAAYIQSHPGSVPTVKQHLAANPHARRLARRRPGPPGEPSRGRPRPEARRHQGGDAGPLAGGDEEAPRDESTRAPWPGSGTGRCSRLRRWVYPLLPIATLGLDATARRDHRRPAEARGTATRD